MPRLLDALKSNCCVVVEAAPGAGETTHVPSALLRTLHEPKAEILGQPRRVVARFVAAEVGCALGREVVYSIRFEGKTGAPMRLQFVTKGFRLQRLSQCSGTDGKPSCREEERGLFGLDMDSTSYLRGACCTKLGVEGWRLCVGQGAEAAREPKQVTESSDFCGQSVGEASGSPKKR